VLGKWKYALGLLALTPVAWSFCGFYVAQEPGSLFNRSSKVVLVRHGDHTVLTMANDYRGDPSAFGLVVPVPQEITADRVRLADGALIERLDQYSMPRLAAYHDADPCPEVRHFREQFYAMSMDGGGDGGGGGVMEVGEPVPPPQTFGVNVQQRYSVGEYDIVVIEAKDGEGLEQWLTREGYQVPAGASRILSSYIKQKMHFFLAKIDLGAQQELGLSWPRPLQVEYDSPRFMLPIRLGTLNAQGAQDLVIFTLTERGRVETTNYRTSRMPTDIDLPEYIADGGNFGTFYQTLFERQVARDGMSAVYLEYAWPLSQPCDPCSAEMLAPGEFAPLGAGWTARIEQDYHGGTLEQGYLTRLHVRYDAAHFPEDLVFQETADTESWQARYVVHHRFAGDTSCEAGRHYEREVAERQDREVINLSRLTGWSVADIREFVPTAR
jgi:hypothetical protein